MPKTLTPVTSSGRVPTRAAIVGATPDRTIIVSAHGINPVTDISAE